MRNLALYLLMLFPISALAHPGHDHAHWFSSAFHMIFFLAIAGLAAVAIFFFRRRVAQKTIGRKK